MITQYDAWCAGKVAAWGWCRDEHPTQFLAVTAARVAWSESLPDFSHGDFSRGHRLRMAFWNGWLAAGEGMVEA